MYFSIYSNYTKQIVKKIVLDFERHEMSQLTCTCVKVN